MSFMDRAYFEKNVRYSKKSCYVIYIGYAR